MKPASGARRVLLLSSEEKTKVAEARKEAAKKAKDGTEAADGKKKVIVPSYRVRLWDSDDLWEDLSKSYDARLLTVTEEDLPVSQSPTKILKRDVDQQSTVGGSSNESSVDQDMGKDDSQW